MVVIVCKNKEIEGVSKRLQSLKDVGIVRYLNAVAVQDNGEVKGVAYVTEDGFKALKRNKVEVNDSFKNIDDLFKGSAEKEVTKEEKPKAGRPKKTV